MSETEKKEPQISKKVEALCPNGCGTKLIKQKFVNVFDKNGAISLKDTEENLYCQKCGLRWIPEQHNPLNTKETNPKNKTEKNELLISLNLPIEDLQLLEKMAEEKNKDINTIISELIHEKTSTQLRRLQASIEAFELCIAHLKDTNEIKEAKTQVAGDLLVAKIALDYNQNGTIEEEKVKAYIKELF